MIYTFQIR